MKRGTIKIGYVSNSFTWASTSVVFCKSIDLWPIISPMTSFLSFFKTKQVRASAAATGWEDWEDLSKLQSPSASSKKKKGATKFDGTDRSISMPYDISVNSLSFLSIPCHGPCLFVGILRIRLELLKMLSPTWHIIVMLKWERKVTFSCLIVWYVID